MLTIGKGVRGLVERAGVDWVPALTAAKLLRVSRQRVYQLLSEGKLVGQKMDGHVLVYRFSLMRRMGDLRKGGV